MSTRNFIIKWVMSDLEINKGEDATVGGFNCKAQGKNGWDDSCTNKRHSGVGQGRKIKFWRDLENNEKLRTSSEIEAAEQIWNLING